MKFLAGKRGARRESLHLLGTGGDANEYAHVEVDAERQERFDCSAVFGGGRGDRVKDEADALGTKVSP